MEKPPRFGDWSRTEFTTFLEMTAIALLIGVGVELAGRLL
jgi:hypothetical protein